MGLITLPDPVSMYEGAKNAGLEREEVNAFVSTMYSGWVAFLWRAGNSKWIQVLGLGQALQDLATSMYLTLERELESAKNVRLVLTLPKDLLDPDNLSKFQTSFKEK